MELWSEDHVVFITMLSSQWAAYIDEIDGKLYGQKLKLSRTFHRTHKFQVQKLFHLLSLQHTEWSKSSPDTVSPYLPNSEQKWAQSIFRQFAVGSLLKKRSDLKVFLDVSSLFFTPVFCRIFLQESSFRILALKSQIEATYPNQILLRRL